MNCENTNLESGVITAFRVSITLAELDLTQLVVFGRLYAHTLFAAGVTSVAGAAVSLLIDSMRELYS